MKSDSGIMDYIKSEIKYVCNCFKKRTAGSNSEYRCQMHFRKELGKWSDHVSAEKFELHPDAFLGWMVPAAVLSMVGAACVVLGNLNIWMSVIGVFCTSLTILMAIFEFVLYRKFIDFAYPRMMSVNIFASKKPVGKVKRRIIFGGHADAAHEMRYILKPGKKTAMYIVLGALTGLVYIWAANALILLGITSANIVLSLVSAAFFPFFVALLFFINKKQVVDGANDNLSGCYVAIGVLKKMHEAGVHLENTEICCLITGGEESGLRGATAFARAHKKEFLETETVFIALETLRETDHLKIYTRGINGTQKNSGYVADLLRAAGRKIDLDLEAAPFYSGAMDSDAFSREGLLACGLGGVNHEPQTYYHTRHDTYDNIGEECIEAALAICMNVVEEYDRRVERAEDASDELVTDVI